MTPPFHHAPLRRVAELLGDLVAAEERIGGRQDRDARACVDALFQQRLHDERRAVEGDLRRADEGHVVAAEDQRAHGQIAALFGVLPLREEGEAVLFQGEDKIGKGADRRRADLLRLVLVGGKRREIGELLAHVVAVDMDDGDVIFCLLLPELVQFARKHRVFHEARFLFVREDARELLQKRLLRSGRLQCAAVVTRRRDAQLRGLALCNIALAARIVGGRRLIRAVSGKRQTRVGNRRPRKCGVLLLLELQDERGAVRRLGQPTAVGCEIDRADGGSRLQSRAAHEKLLREAAHDLRRRLACIGSQQNQRVAAADVGDTRLLRHSRPVGRGDLAPSRIVKLRRAADLADDGKQHIVKDAVDEIGSADLRLETAAGKDVLLNRACVEKQCFQLHQKASFAEFIHF